MPVERIYYRKLIDLKMESERNSLILQPHYQRRFTWDIKKQSRLIESILLDYPINPLHFAEVDEFKSEVIDGQQRLTSVFRFLDNKSKLIGLRSLPMFNGKMFNGLPEKAQRSIMNYSIGIYPYSGDESLKFEIFERLNTGSTTLTPQELRNAIYHGTYNSLIKDLGETAESRFLLTNPKKMKNYELVLAFFTLNSKNVLEQPHKNQFKHEWRQMLNEELAFNRNLGEVELKSRKTKWERFLNACSHTFDMPFRRRITKLWRFNENLFHAACIIVPKYPLEKIILHSSELKAAFTELHSSPEFTIDTTQNALYSTLRTFAIIPWYVSVFEKVLYGRDFPIRPEQLELTTATHAEELSEELN